MSLHQYECEVVNPYGGKDFYEGNYHGLDEAIKGFAEILEPKGYRIIKVFQIIGRGHSESQLNL